MRLLCEAPAMAPALASDLKVIIGDIDRKVDMALDDIIKLSKQKIQRRFQSKNRNNKRLPQPKREALQKSVALRSAAIRQGKLAEARLRNGGFGFAATKVAAQKAIATPVRKPWYRQPRQVSSRPSGPRTPNFRMPFAKQLNTARANARPSVQWTGGAMKNRVVTQRQAWGAKKMMVNGTGRQPQPQTLDSRFASLREGRQLYVTRRR